MRTVLNISIPASVAKEIKDEVRKGKFASTSEFIRHVWRTWQTERVVREVKVSERQFAQGKFKVLKSFKDLR
jgi:Arc/MetJ-type ribon-helix-helix transcriptional regulator